MRRIRPPSRREDLDRRAFFRAAGRLGLGSLLVAEAAALADCGGSAGSTTAPGAPAPGFASTVTHPPEIGGGTLAASVGSQSIWSGATTAVWTLGGSFPGPTIRIGRGASFSARIENRLSEPTNVHWHGLAAPPEMDGHPSDVIAPGQSRDIAFPIVDRAGTYWYHPHPDGRTARQVYGGMAGFFIVEDEREAALGLPSGEYDVPLVLQDRRTSPDHSLTYAPGPMDLMAGCPGRRGAGERKARRGAAGRRDALSPAPSQRIERPRVPPRLRGRPLVPRHRDGRRSAGAPRPRDRFRPRARRARRDPRRPGARSRRHFDSPEKPGLHRAGGDGRRHDARHGRGWCLLRAPRSTCCGCASNDPGPSARVPAALVPFERLDPARAEGTQAFTLSMGMMPVAGAFTINGRSFDPRRIDVRARRGRLELWEVRNASSEPHPFHVHATSFQVVSRTSGPLGAQDLGWKDTVLTWPGETVTLAIRFEQYAGLYVLHCHNLEHEDAGMMLNLEVS